MATTNSILPPAIDSLVRLPVVKQATGKSRTTIYRDIEKGLMTRPVKIGGGRSAWPQSEIVAINQARIAGKADDEIKTLIVSLEAARVAL